MRIVEDCDYVSLWNSESQAINISINFSLHQPQDFASCNTANPSKGSSGFVFCGADPYAKEILLWEQG